MADLMSFTIMLVANALTDGSGENQISTVSCHIMPTGVSWIHINASFFAVPFLDDPPSTSTPNGPVTVLIALNCSQKILSTFQIPNPVANVTIPQAIILPIVRRAGCPGGRSNVRAMVRSVAVIRIAAKATW